MPHRITAVLLAGVIMVLPAAGSHAQNRATQLIDALGCRGCHRINGGGGSIGPSLEGLGERLTLKQIRSRISHPPQDRPGIVMPVYGHLEDGEFDAIARHLGASDGQGTSGH